jgi:hypothetical protein
VAGSKGYPPSPDRLASPIDLGVEICKRGIHEGLLTALANGRGHKASVRIRYM